MSTQTHPRSNAAYQQSAVLTAPPERLVVMLYDGARRFLYQAAAAMREGRPEAFERLRRAELIVDELLVTLDLERGGRIAQDLQGLYVFFLARMAEARNQADPEILDWVNLQLSELRESWAQIAAGVR